MTITWDILFGCIFFWFQGYYWGCKYRVMVRGGDTLVWQELSNGIMPLNLQGTYPMSRRIKISSVLPLFRFTISRGLIYYLINNVEAVLIILLSSHYKITCAEIYIVHRHMLSTFGNIILAQQLQLKNTFPTDL